MYPKSAKTMAESTPSCSTSGGSDKSSNIQVTVKVRPLIKREKDAKMTKLWRVKENSIQLVEPATNSNEGFTFGVCCVVVCTFGCK